MQQSGDYQGLKQALGRSKGAQNIDEDTYLLQKWGDPLKGLERELSEIGKDTQQGKKLQAQISAVKE